MKRYADIFYCVVACTLIISIGWYAGRAYEAREVEQIRQDYEKMETRVIQSYYGPKSYYFKWRGHTYFVKNKRDLENEKKWIKVK